MSKSLQKTINSALWEVLKPPLQAAGFEKFKDNYAFRYLEDRIDIFELRMAKPGENAGYRTPPNSFSIEVGVFFRFAPHPMGNMFEGEENLPVNSPIDGHFRISSRPNLLLQSGWNSPWWRVDSWNLRRRFILPDVHKNIENYLIPWFDKFDNLDDVRAHVLAINESGGGQQTTKRSADSWGWVYGFKTLPAFFALHLEHWVEAQERLSALLKESHPGHKTDRQKYPEKLYHNIEDMLSEGLAKAESHLS